MNKSIIFIAGTGLVLSLLFFIFKQYKKNKNFTGEKMVERTLGIIKPDAVRAKNSGKIIDRIEKEGFNIIKLEKIHLSKEKAESFYDIHKGKPFFDELVEFMSSGPIIVMVLEKENAISAWRNLMGDTNPEKAADNTLRKLFGTNIGNNATHGSDAPETAAREIKFFFPELA